MFREWSTVSLCPLWFSVVNFIFHLCVGKISSTNLKNEVNWNAVSPYKIHLNNIWIFFYKEFIWILFYSETFWYDHLPLIYTNVNTWTSFVVMLSINHVHYSTYSTNNNNFTVAAYISYQHFYPYEHCSLLNYFFALKFVRFCI